MVRRVWNRYICGVRTVWWTEGVGTFHCPSCGGDRGYRRCSGRRRLVVFGVPLLSRGPAGEMVECSACSARHGVDVLACPTDMRLSGMLADAGYTIALAVLVAGGTHSREAGGIAAEVVQRTGFEECTADHLAAIASLVFEPDDLRVAGEDVVDGVARSEGGSRWIDGCGIRMSTELRQVLEPLAQHLAPQGRDHLLLEGARIALADGPYLPAEHDTLSAIGRCLMMSTARTERLLVAAAHSRS